MRIRMGKQGGAGRVIGSLLLLALVAAGSAGTVGITVDWVRSLISRSWPAVPCRIVTSGVVEEPGDSGVTYRFVVETGYGWQGVSHRSDLYSPRYDGSDDAAEAQRLAHRFPVGSTAACRVDPRRPEVAVLAFDSLLRGLWVLVPLAFLLLGLGGLMMTWGVGGRWLPRWVPHSARGAETSLASRARPGPAGTGRGCLASFFAVFLLAGLGFLVPFFLVPAARVVAARGWQEVPCTIERSALKEHQGDDGSTYSVEVGFTYEVGGRTYKGNRYGFFGGSSSAREAKAAAVERLPPGTVTSCWVDPEDPFSAVVDRDFSGDMLFGLIPLVFVVVGGVGVGWALLGAGAGGRRDRRRAGAMATSPAAETAEWLPEPRLADQLPEGAAGVVLAPRHGPVAKVVGSLAIAVFWNGIVGVFVYQAVRGWQQGAGDGCLTLFMIPFVLVGLLLLVNVPYQLLAAFNPRPVLSLGRATVPLGGEVLLEWRFRGAAHRLRRLRITLQGEEEATYRRGTDTHTARETFAEIDVVDLARPHPLERGHVGLRLPADTMHSFAAPRNKVIWKLKVHGEIRRWPDVADEHELVVTPAGGD